MEQGAEPGGWRISGDDTRNDVVRCATKHPRPELLILAKD